MKGTFTKLAFVILAVLAFCSGMMASSTPPQDQTSQLAVSQASSGIEIALLSILLGGGMVFLFRPKRNVVAD